MDVLVIGAAGMVGRKLVSKLAAGGVVGGRVIDRLILADVVAPEAPAFEGNIDTVPADLSEPGVADTLLATRPQLIFHLAAVVSGEAEADFEKGYRVNLDGTRALLEAVRMAGSKESYVPKLVFAS